MTTSEETGATPSRPALTIEGKWFGRGNKPLFPNFEMPLPPAWHGATVTLRELLESIVRIQVAQFRERQEKRTVLQALSATQIAEGVAKGKIDSGGTPDALQEVNSDDAVQTALQAFEDGLFYVFIDDVQKEALSDAFVVAPETRVTFLRLVALAGG